MLQRVLTLGKPTAVCTIYDAIPGLDLVEKTGLCLFNDVILREAFRASVPVIDLRLVCIDGSDYSRLSPIEPSVIGGERLPGQSHGYSPSTISGQKPGKFSYENRLKDHSSSTDIANH